MKSSDINTTLKALREFKPLRQCSTLSHYLPFQNIHPRLFQITFNVQNSWSFNHGKVAKPIPDPNLEQSKISKWMFVIRKPISAKKNSGTCRTTFWKKYIVTRSGSGSVPKSNQIFLIWTPTRPKKSEVKKQWFFRFKKLFFLVFMDFLMVFMGFLGFNVDS